MSNQILTQEEIDALLSAMERGDVDLEQEPAKDVDAAPYNLTSQDIILRDQFSALEEVYDKFLRPEYVAVFDAKNHRHRICLD